MRWIILCVAIVVTSIVLQFALDIPDVIWDEGVHAGLMLMAVVFAYVAGIETEAMFRRSAAGSQQPKATERR